MSKKKNDKKRKIRVLFCVLLCVGLVLVVGVGLLVKHNLEEEKWKQIENMFPDRGVPRMNITLNGVTLEEINGGVKETKYEGNKLAVYDERKNVLQYDDVRVKGRGNGTWVQKKKPYQIKFENKVDMFGMGKAKKWVLLANAMDDSNVRTATAFNLAKMLDMKYTYAGEFIELYINGDYNGLYYLTHGVEIGKNTVDLKDSMGVLVELDNLYWEGERYYVTRGGDKLVLKDVVVEDSAENVMRQFLESYNEFEVAVIEKDFKRIEELIDVESFVKYYLLSEFIVNPDAYWTSFFMYKDGSEDKIHVGPGWDFDLAFANRNWGNWMGEEFYSPVNTMVRKGEFLTRDKYEEMGLGAEGENDWYELSLRLSHIMFDLMEIPEFKKEVEKVFLERLKGRKEEVLSKIETEATSVMEASLVNEKKWGKEGFLQEVEMIKKWVAERFDYFDEVYSGEALLPIE